MNDAVDLLDHLIDERARRAAMELRRAASLRSLPDPVPPRSTAARTVVLTVAVTIAVVVGLIVIGNRQNNSEPAGPDDDLHWVIDGLPQGWSPVGVLGPATAKPLGGPGLPIVTIFGSAAAPAGPVFEVYVNDDNFQVQPAQGDASDYDERTVDGVDVVLASRSGGARLAWSRVDDRWVPLVSRGMTDPELLDAAAHLVVADDRSVQIAADHLPAGVATLASGSIETVAPAWWAGLSAQGTSADTISITYASAPTGGAIVSLTVSRTVGGQLAFAALQSNALEPVDVDGIRVWQVMSQQGLPAAAAWQRDGRFFMLSTSQPGQLDLPALAAGVRAALPDEWSVFPTVTGGIERSEQTAVTEVAGTVLTPVDEGVSAATDPPAVVSGDVRDIALDWAIADLRPHQATLEATLPDGPISHVEVTIVGDSVNLAGGDLGSMAFPWKVGDPTKLEWQGIGALAFTHDGDAVALRVRRANGDRYTIALVTVSGEPDTRFAVLTLPGNEFVSSDLLDADGNVLEHFAHP